MLAVGFQDLGCVLVSSTQIDNQKRHALAEARKQWPEVLRSRLLAVYGVWQREGNVMNSIAGQLQDLSPQLGQLSTTSRDFD